jgi:large subunit ribosomal protein L28
MSRVCDIIANKKIRVGYNDPKSHHKTKRVFIPNLQSVSFKSDLLSKDLQLKLSTRAIRSVMKHGTIDSYILTAKNNSLTIFAQGLRRKMKKALLTSGVTKELPVTRKTEVSKRLIKKKAKQKA